METYFCISTERNSSSLGKILKYFDLPYKIFYNFYHKTILCLTIAKH